ncbi:MAG: sugar phosphate isomerase/epimerase [Candidatus Latescibacterota bacterium]|nr:sugar phosphate isomerase/epimerase [Candidatus Latescibacterota bacterium]
MARIPIALQLYSIREDCARDLEGSIESVAEMGYEGVEFAGYYERDADELKGLCDAHGLQIVGTHIGLDTLLGDALEGTMAFNKTLDNRYLIVPGLAEERRNSRAAWLATAGLFDEIATRLEPHDMQTGYHNHHIEFQNLEGELPWDTFFGNTRQEVVMQLDTGNMYHGGAAPVGFLAKYPGRSQLVHLKEYSSSNDQALIGEGEVEWARVFEICESSGSTEWYIVEQESYAHPPLECVERCLRNLQQMGK